MLSETPPWINEYGVQKPRQFYKHNNHRTVKQLGYCALLPQVYFRQKTANLVRLQQATNSKAPANKNVRLSQGVCTGDLFRRNPSGDPETQLGKLRSKPRL